MYFVEPTVYVDPWLIKPEELQKVTALQAQYRKDAPQALKEMTALVKDGFAISDMEKSGVWEKNVTQLITALGWHVSTTPCTKTDVMHVQLTQGFCMDGFSGDPDKSSGVYLLLLRGYFQEPLGGVGSYVRFALMRTATPIDVNRDQLRAAFAFPRKSVTPASIDYEDIISYWGVNKGDAGKIRGVAVQEDSLTIPDTAPGK